MHLKNKNILSAIIIGGCLLYAFFLSGIVFTPQCWSHQIVLEWNRDLRPRSPRRDWRVSFSSISISRENRLMVTGSKSLIWEARILPSYYWFGTLNENVDSVYDQRCYGDSVHIIECAPLHYDEGTILFGKRSQIFETERQTADSRRIALLYLDEDGDSSDFFEFEARRRPGVKSAFVNEDGSVDIFASYTEGHPFEKYRVNADRDTFETWEYDEEEYFGDGRFSGAYSITRLREGDYIITGGFSPVRYQGDLRIPTHSGCVMRMDEDGELVWMNVHLDSTQMPNGHYAYTNNGSMKDALEHSSGFIYATGWTDRFADPTWGIALYKYHPDGDLLWTCYYNDNYGVSVYDAFFRQIIEVRPDLLAVFGRIDYRRFDEREEEGIYVALIDTSGEFLTGTFIHGEWIEDGFDKFMDILQVEPTRVLALTYYMNRICSIRFDLDPDESGIAESRFLFPSSLSVSAYPNPFNSSTVITYSLNKPGHARLILYDTSGRIVTVLNEGFTRQGVHRQQIDAALFPSGIYFVRLEAGDRVDVRKVVCLE